MKYCWILYYHWTKEDPLAKIWVGRTTDKWINPWPITLSDWFKDDSKWRKELLREWWRILNDLKWPETEVWKENYDWTYTLLKNVGKWG